MIFNLTIPLEILLSLFMKSYIVIDFFFFHKPAKRKLFFWIVFVFSESWATVSKTLLKSASLHKIHYNITAMEKVL